MKVKRKILLEASQEAQYQYSCVDCGSKLNELEYIIDHERQVSYATFIKNVDKEFVKDFNRSAGVPISKDWAVSFHKSKLPNGKTVWYFAHSSIEYVFY